MNHSLLSYVDEDAVDSIRTIWATTVPSETLKVSVQGVCADADFVFLLRKGTQPLCETTLEFRFVGR
jgi:hypothetical protein